MASETNQPVVFSVDRYSETGGCKGRCVDAIRLGYKFRKYNPDKDYLFSVFDNLGREIYVDAEGKEHSVLYHQHWGVVYSYSHYYLESPDPTWKFVRNEGIDSDEVKKEIVAVYYNPDGTLKNPQMEDINDD